MVRSANSGALPLNYMITIFLKHTIFGFSIILFSSLIIFFSGFKNYYRLIIYSGYLLILINFILHTIGIEAIPKNIIVGDYGNASVLELFNIYTKRVLFLFSTWFTIIWYFCWYLFYNIRWQIEIFIGYKSNVPFNVCNMLVFIDLNRC